MTHILSFDVSTGGISAAIFTPDFKTSRVVEKKWEIADALPLDVVLNTFKAAAREIRSSTRIDAVSIACFMHSIVLLDRDDRPLSPVFTWLDRRGVEAVETFRAQLGTEFHQRTGCRFHPMFPVFKLAALHVPEMVRAVSVKSILLKELTGIWIEDYGMASASGMYNILQDGWDQEILSLAGLQPQDLTHVSGKNEIIGTITPRAQLEYGISAGTSVVNGSGDGLLANSGSGCDSADRIAVTLGTSASARQSLKTAVLDESAGTFCYKADAGTYVLGCAGSNGGNVLDWARRVFAGSDVEASAVQDLPIFIPLLHGERSPDWNAQLTGSWHGLRSSHSTEDLRRSVIEGVVFNLVQYTEILQRTSGVKAQEIVLSGNGFLNETAARVLASLVPAVTLFVPEPGLASLRGAVMCGLRAVGQDPEPAMENLVGQATVVEAGESNAVHARFESYKKLRQEIADGAQ